MKRLLYTVLIGLVLAGIIHILIVLLIPFYAQKDAWAKLGSTGGEWAFTVVAEPGAGKTTALPLVDPSFGVAACRFDLSKSPLIVEAGGVLPFWSVSLFDRRGQNVYSFNDRTAIGRQLFMIVVDPVQMARMRRNPPEEAERAVLVETDIDKGFVLIRAFLDHAGREADIRTFLKDARCERYQLPEDPVSTEGET